MLTGKEDLLQALIEIYLMEKGINQFYSELSVKAESPETRRMFTNLANWEAEHTRHIQEFYQTLTEERETTSFDEFAKRATPDIVEGGRPLAELRGKIKDFAFLDDTGAIKFALSIEQDEFGLYQKLASDTPDTNVKALCEEFMGWEQRHIEHLRRMLKERETSPLK